MPRPITAANKGTLYAIGKGDLKINVPNSDESVPVILVFYSTQINLTIVSIGHIVKAKKSVLFEDDYCFIMKK